MKSETINKILLISLCSIFLFVVQISAQKKWDAGGGDSLWSNPLNWEGDAVPMLADDVLLDNSFVSGDYTVVLPSGSNSVSVNSIRISPAPPFSVRLIIPVSNTAIPALTVNGPPGIMLDAGAVFINSSGGSPGAAVVVSDSLRIANGARYVHNSGNAHAALVSRLSKAPGTEKGVFEFNVPGAASYTVSIAGRTYGNLELSAAAAGGSKSYLSNGATAMQANGNLKIGSGVNYSLDFSGNITVYGDLMILGNFNLSSGSNNNLIKVHKNLDLQGMVTESGSGSPVIELAGNTTQQVAVPGSIKNNVVFRLNNLSGCISTTPISLPFKLELIKGKLITSSSNLLTLQANCIVQVDSTNANAFIDGPLRKLELSNIDHFLFPVGKGTSLRWLAVKEFSGDITAEYHRINPQAISSVVDSTLDHISSLEYWSLLPESNATGKIELSFDHVNSGGVTSLTSLRVARLVNGIWVDAGNMGSTGSAGAAGSVFSTTCHLSLAQPNLFTLSSTEATQNPLPLEPVSFNIRKLAGHYEFLWRIDPSMEARHFFIEKSFDAVEFSSLKELNAAPGKYFYSLLVKQEPRLARFFRLRTTDKSGAVSYSRVVALPLYNARNDQTLYKITYAPVSGQPALFIHSAYNCSVELIITDLLGHVIRKQPVFLRKGQQHISLPTNGLRTGYYGVFGLSSCFQINPIIFFKP
jgi:hypothetical protein